MSKPYKGKRKKNMVKEPAVTYSPSPLKLSTFQQQRIDESLQQIQEGKVISNEESERLAGEWLKE